MVSGGHQAPVEGQGEEAEAGEVAPRGASLGLPHEPTEVGGDRRFELGVTFKGIGGERYVAKTSNGVFPQLYN